LQQRLEETGRESWLEEEVAILTDPKTYAFDPADAWKRLKLGGKSRLSRAIIIELAAWRERTAQIENLPRARVLKDEVIYEVAKHAPRSLEALGRLRPVREVLKSRGEAILSCVEEAIAAPSIKAEHAAAHAELSATESATVELLRVLAKAVAAELNVAPRLIASSDDLEKLAQQECPDIPAMKGWRYEIFGERAMALKEGRLALGLKDGQVTFCTL
jgi:ribonuclease D